MDKYIYFLHIKYETLIEKVEFFNLLEADQSINLNNYLSNIYNNILIYLNN